MKILRRLWRATRARLRQDESGFTLAELLVVISISSTIVLVLGAAFTAAAKTSMDARTRLDESGDAKLLNAYFVSDGAGASYFSKSALPPSTPAPAPCAISDITGGTPVALFAWTDSAGVKKNAFYVASGSSLIRRFCSAGVRTADTTVVRNLNTDPAKRPSVACNPTHCFGASGTSGVPASAALTVTAKSGYAYTVVVSFRGTDVLATNDGPPSIRSMVHDASTPTPSNRTQIQYRVTFSEAVTGVDKLDFFVTGSQAGATVNSVIGVGGGTAYTVVVDTPDPIGKVSNATVTLNLGDNDSIKDRTGKPLNGTGTGNTAGEQFTIDKIKPTVTLVQAGSQADPTTTPTIHFTATFSEPVSGFDATKVTLGGTAPGATATVTPAGTNAYDVVVTGMTSSGSVTASIAADVVTDTAGNLNTASTGVDNTVAYNTPPVATTTAVVSSANPSVVGQAVTYTATVTVTAPGTGNPTGTVTFKDGATSICTNVGVTAGAGNTATATCTPAAYAVIGTHSITAVYNGVISFTTSTSTALTQTVSAASTTTAVVSSANPSGVGQAVTYTATVTVTAPGTGNPTGTVTFKDGATSICTNVGVTAGPGNTATATCTPAAYAVIGTHSITAVYNGVTSFTTSTSTALTQTVSVMPTFFVLDAADKLMYKYDANGAPLGSWALDAANDDPTGSAVVGSYVYVLDNTDKKIYRYTTSGGSVTASSTLGVPSGYPGIGSLHGLAIQGDDIWLLDRITGSSAGDYPVMYSLADAFPANGTIQWQRYFNPLTSPAGLAIDSTYLYVTDTSTDRVYRYQRSGGNATGPASVSKVIYDTSGTSPGDRVQDPRAAMMLGGALWVVDGTTTQAFRYNLSTLGFTGSAPSGSANAALFFDLASGNDDPRGL